MCLRFAAMEALHGESERARAIYVHASTYCDPRTMTAFWKTWQDFEVEHGNEESFREMLRIKRSVATSFSSANYAVEELLQQASGVIPAISAVASALADADGMAAATPAPLAGMKRSAAQALLPGMRAVPMSVEVSSTSAAIASAVNPDEIDLDGSEETAADSEVDVMQRQVPTAVFGGLSTLADSQAGGGPVGALDRFRSRKH